MNNVQYVSATKMRNDWFNWIDFVRVNKKTIVVTKNDKPLVEVNPTIRTKTENIDEFIKKTNGMFASGKHYFPYEDSKVTKLEIKRQVAKFKKYASMRSR